MELTKQHIQSLPIDDLVHLVNDTLQNFDSLRNFCKHYDVTYNELTKRFSSGNYIYVQQYKRYLKINLVEGTLSLSPEESFTPTSDNSIAIEEKAFISYLLSNKEVLISILEHNLNKNDVIIDTRILTSTCVTSKKITVYDEIYTQFIELCTKQYPQYQTKYLLSQALLEFIDKYSDATL